VGGPATACRGGLAGIKLGDGSKKTVGCSSTEAAGAAGAAARFQLEHHCGRGSSKLVTAKQAKATGEKRKP
jgi:hypothetical protein